MSTDSCYNPLLLHNLFNGAFVDREKLPPSEHPQEINSGFPIWMTNALSNRLHYVHIQFFINTPIIDFFSPTGSFVGFVTSAQGSQSKESMPRQAQLEGVKVGCVPHMATTKWNKSLFLRLFEVHYRPTLLSAFFYQAKKRSRKKNTKYQPAAMTTATMMIGRY